MLYVISSANSEDDDDDEDELGIVQKELDELLVKKEELEKDGEIATPTANGGMFHLQVF